MFISSKCGTILAYHRVCDLFTTTEAQYSHSQPRYGHRSSKVGFLDMKSREYQPGEIIIQEGEMSRDLFLLTDGVAQVSKKIASKSILLSEIEPPQVFGELAFYTGIPRTATVRAKTKVEVVIFRFDILKDQIASLPTWIKRTLDTLINRIKSCDKRIIELEGEILKLKGK